jgi:FAD/FMN-containing dehydrogenase
MDQHGRDPDDHDDDDDEEDAPLDEAEAAAGDDAADEALDESLDERAELVLEDLPGVTRRRDGEVVLLAVRERVFAVLGPDLLEVGLDAPVAKAALRTPDTRPSPRGAGWIAFTPKAPDRFALDRAEAWLRLGHRRAAG